MGQISSLAAPSAPQFQSLIVKPVPRAAAALITPDLGSQIAAQKLRAELPPETTLRPMLPPAQSEAIFKGLLPVQPALAQAQQAKDNGQIETLTEVDGISLDGIPYLRDGAVLLDDLPQAEPAPAPKAKPKPATAGTMALVVAMPVNPEIEPQVEPEQALSDQAERAYLQEREISAVRAEPAAASATEAAPPDQASADQPDVDTASSVDQHA